MLIGEILTVREPQPRPPAAGIVFGFERAADAAEVAGRTQQPPEGVIVVADAGPRGRAEAATSKSSGQELIVAHVSIRARGNGVQNPSSYPPLLSGL